MWRRFYTVVAIIHVYVAVVQFVVRIKMSYSSFSSHLFFFNIMVLMKHLFRLRINILIALVSSRSELSKGRNILWFDLQWVKGIF